MFYSDYEDTGLRFAGKVRAGFVPHLRREVFKALKPHHADDYPFVDLPQSKSPRWGGGVTADDAVGEAGAGGADTVRGVDGGGSPETCGILGPARGQERARGAARDERIHFVTVSVRPQADARATLVSCIPARVSRTADARRRGDVRDLR